MKKIECNLTYRFTQVLQERTSEMEKSDAPKEPTFVEYIYQLNEGHHIFEALEHSLKEIDKIDVPQLKRIGLKTYEEGKWTIHTIIQHLIDWERIWCFRAILFAREEGTIPDAHDQEIMAQNSKADERSIEELVNELRMVRQSTILLFESFNRKLLDMTCRFFEYEMPLAGLGFSITAHQIHHLNVIKERYLPLDK